MQKAIGEGVKLRTDRTATHAQTKQKGNTLKK
jgi:hypothetical protein